MDKNTWESVAHSCPSWVMLKKELKGERTHLKLAWLSQYLDPIMGTDEPCCDRDVRLFQVRHYLGTMVKDKLLYSFPMDFAFEGNWVTEMAIKDSFEAVYDER